MKHRWSTLAPALLRRSLQTAVLVFVSYAAINGIWRNYKVAHNSSRLVGLMHGDAWAGAYAANEAAVSLIDEDTYRASFDFLGMTWSGTLFGIETADPILALSHAAATGAASPRLWLGSLVAVAVAVVLGKFFCSHLCPMRTLFDVGQALRGGLLFLGVPLPHLRVEPRLGGWVLLGGLIASTGTAVTVWFFLLPYLSLVAAVFLAVTSGLASGLIAIVGLWLFVDVAMAPGLFCHNVCPQGFLLEQLGRRAWLRLSRDDARPCPRPCRTCTLACPFGLSPREGTHRPACNSCGQCVPVCPERKLSRRLRLPVIAAVLVALGAVPSMAGAHHNKGLPHYGYYSNYPQVPFDESIVVDGRWEMGTTIFNFQGLDRRTADTPNDVKFFVYLYDLVGDTNYEGPVAFDILRNDEIVASFRRDRADEETVYSTRETLPESGEYELRATFDVGGQPQRVSLTFWVDLAADEVSWGLIAAILGPIIPLLMLAALGRSRRGRARRLQSQLEPRSTRPAKI
ncbi:MAG: 4Fe-4S binding protein [Myxococcales bacterium FL481]|nr:MAG: 4Fe-4S binding protein [Myxococcales bacterium FL481]